MATVAMAIAIDLALGGVRVDSDVQLLTLAAMAGREVIIGSAMGLSLRLLLAAFEAAGVIAGTSMGLSLNIFVDPTTGDESMPMGALLGLVATLIFLALGGDHIVIETFFAHMNALPVGSLNLVLPSPETLAIEASLMMTHALLLAAPVVGVTLSLNIALAFVSRVVPAVNLFGIGLSLLIIGGYIALGLSGDASVVHLDEAMRELPRRMIHMVGEP